MYCPPIVNYSKEYNELLANELESLPLDSAIPMAITDYVKLRDKVRKCEEERGNL